MSKVGLKETIKDLNQKAGVILSETERLRRNADIMLQMLRQQEIQFLRQEDEERLRTRHEAQQQMLQQQTKAWTMPDEEEQAVLDAANEKAAQNAAPVPAPEAKAEAPAAPKGKPRKVHVEVAAAETVEIASSEAAPAPEKPAEPVVASTAEVVRPAVTAGKQPPVKELAPPTVANPPQATPAPRPVSPVQRGQFAPQQPGQFVSQQAPRPSGAPQYGRPAPGSPQFGRPISGALPQFGRPVSGAVPQYGRPAPGSPQFGRPAPGSPQFGRPVLGAAPFARPAPAGGQFGRPPFPGRPPMPGRPGMSRPGMVKPATDEMLPTIEKDRVSNYDPNKKSYIRKPDPEHVSKQRKQSVRKSQPTFLGSDDEIVRGGKRARSKKPSAQQMMAPIRIETAFMTAQSITVKDLTERIGKPAGEILKKLLLIGNMATINSELDFDTASLVCSEFGVELVKKLDQTAEDQMIASAGHADEETELKPRPPVITIMGHVDHGKTSLLDYIRHTHVTRGEAGGITQHIGAYSVLLNDQMITFLDTPGHEAFTAMRARGAQATDIAVLVVAADDGVMPQTVEAIKHAQAAKVPIIVAINKMDKPDANPDRVKQDLTAYSLVSEEWGGETIMVPVSAQTGEGIEQLLEMILLQSEVLQLRANPDRLGRGVIIEAKLDKTRGALATVLMKNGTLHVGDNIIAGMTSGRVRALLNDKGESVKEAGPSMPVEISGFSSVPQAGDEMIVVEDDKLVRQVAKEREDRIKEQRVGSSSAVSLDNLYQSIKEGEQLTLDIIIKADVQGSAEAVRQSLEKLSSELVKIHVLHSGVGAITKDDVNLAATSNAIIIGFNIRPDNNAREVAAKENIDIRLYRIIYQVIEDIQKAMKGMLKPEFKEVILGHAEVRNVFKITGAGTIAGSYVLDGKMTRNQSVRLLRDNVVVFEGKLSSLRRFKDDVREVASGFECGIGLENYNDIKEKDIVECFLMEEIER
jgi:translation initiation factor IF-2